MKRLVTAMVITAICMCGCTKEIQYTTRYITNCENTELREIPSNTGKVLDNPAYGEAVSHVENVENGYAKVAYNGMEGFVLASHLTGEKPEETKMPNTAQTNAPQQTAEPMQKEEPAVPENQLKTMTAEQRREVNLFLSNFSEAYYNPNGGYYGEEEAKISFAHIHAGINLGDVTLFDGEYMGISADKVDEILTRFFGSSVPHRTPENGKYWFYDDGKFMMPAASGESYADFSIATEMRARADGNFDVSFNIYADPTVTGGDIISDKSVYSLTDAEAAAKYHFQGSGTAVLKPKTHNGSDTYELVSYSPVYSY